MYEAVSKCLRLLAAWTTVLKDSADAHLNAALSPMPCMHMEPPQTQATRQHTLSSIFGVSSTPALLGGPTHYKGPTQYLCEGSSRRKAGRCTTLKLSLGVLCVATFQTVTDTNLQRPTRSWCSWQHSPCPSSSLPTHGKDEGLPVRPPAGCSTVAERRPAVRTRLGHACAPARSTMCQACVHLDHMVMTQKSSRL